MSDTSFALRFRYPYEEFADDIKSMPTVRRWEYTSRFGHVGTAQTSRANNARVLEYFSDSYADPNEAVFKAERFLSICDYLGRHTAVFARKGLIELDENNFISAEPALLRAVHCAFTLTTDAALTEPKRVIALARALQQIEQ